VSNDKDEPKFHGGTLGDRFADAGHAARVPLQNGGGDRGRNPAGRSCSIQLGVAVMVAAALLAVPFLPLKSPVRR
jgi:hypothetical protein